MYKNKKWIRCYVWADVYYEEECTKHSYSWNGAEPCTGIFCCMLCGKPKKGDGNELTKINNTF